MTAPSKAGGIVTRIRSFFCRCCRTRTAHILIPDRPSGEPVVDGILQELGLSGQWRCGRCRKANA